MSKAEDDTKKTLRAIQQARSAGGGRAGRLAALAQSDYLEESKRKAIGDILWGSEVVKLDTWVKLVIFAETIMIAVLYTLVIVLLIT
jgi:hypothetical protein